jgi:hypothetical protein
MENYQKGDFDRRPGVWLKGNMHEEKRRESLVRETLAFVRKIDTPAPPIFYCREIVLNMYVKFSRSGVQARSGADMDG